MGHSARDGGSSICQGGVAAKIQMALIELEVVCKSVAPILCPTLKKKKKRHDHHCIAGETS